eukprot:scaffold3307_cov265-Pinguiococcus_pyrenoidosus.AAC.15
MEIFTNPRRSGRSSGISLWPSSGDAYKMVSRQARSSSASAFTVPTLLCTFCPYVRLGSVLRGFFAAALSFGVDLGVAFAPSDSRPVPFPFRLGPRPLPFLPFLPAAFAFAFAEGFVPGFGGFFAPLDDLFVVFGAVFPSAASAAAPEDIALPQLIDNQRREGLKDDLGPDGVQDSTQLGMRVLAAERKGQACYGCRGGRSHHRILREGELEQHLRCRPNDLTGELRVRELRVVRDGVVALILHAKHVRLHEMLKKVPAVLLAPDGDSALQQWRPGEHRMTGQKQDRGQMP